MENSFKYIVYQTINIVNNKIYIGVHKTKDITKFDNYIGCGVNISLPSTYMNPKTPFQYAVKKYGTSSFKRSIIYVFQSMEEAYDKEKEIVTTDFINRPDTYNAVIGGMYHYDTKKDKSLISYSKIYQFDIKGNLIKEWDDIYEVSEFLGTWKLSVYLAIRAKTRLYSCYWSYNKEINISEFSNPNQSRKVYLYNKLGKCVAVHNSVGEAAKYNNMTASHIVNSIKDGAFTKESFYLSYELYDEYVHKPRLDLKRKEVFLYDLDGNFVKKIKVKDLKKEYNVNSYKTISNVILNKSSFRGYLIRTEYTESIEKYSPKNKKRAVLVYTIDGNFVKEFESVSSACKELKLDSSTVSKILRGCGKTTKGYTIKYKTEDIV